MIARKIQNSAVHSLLAGLALCIHNQAIAQEKATGQFPGIEQLPASRFQEELSRLSPAAQKRANEILNGIHFNHEDTGSLHAHQDGSICFSCRFGHQDVPADQQPPPPPISEADLAKAPLALAPFPEELKFNSRPGSSNVLWLNFEGQKITGTEWNVYVNRAEIAALPFSTDDKYDQYSATEQAMIKQIWQRVAEDYATFDINVTTEKPTVINNQTAVCIITGNKDKNGKNNPAPEAGGVAYVDVFGTDDFITKYSPAFVYHNNLQNRADYITEAASHEVGHNMGLSHDGTTAGVAYYGGHGSGDTSWGTIMGTGYDQNVSQWSKGEYYQANNLEDDLAIIEEKVGYRADDHAGTSLAATPLVITDGTVIESTNPETDPDNFEPENKGVIETADDVDVFSFTTGFGSVSVLVDPWRMSEETNGGNLDILLELYDDAGNLLQTSNPEQDTRAVVAAVLEQGTYFVHIKNTGAGDPSASSPSGYTGYGSIGQYFINGMIVEVPPQPPVLNEVRINNDALYTTSADVLLNHKAGGGIPDEYRASENADLSGATWQPYSSLPPFTLGGYGERTVYMQVRNSLGTSLVVSDTINFPDPADPPILSSMTINEGAATTETNTVAVQHTWTGGLPTQYRVSENADFAGSAWQTYVAEANVVLSGFGSRTVYFQLRNTNGTSGILSDTILYPRPAAIRVSFGGVAISSGYTTPSSGNGTDFGTIKYQATPNSRTYTVSNTGDAALSIESVIVPVGFILTEKLPASIAGGASATFTVGMSNTLTGVKIGQVIIANGDSTQPTYQFRIHGVVEPLDQVVNTRPVAQPARIRTLEDEKVSFELTGTDPQGKKLRYRIVEKPMKGVLMGTAPNLVYIPDRNKNGLDSFTFQVDNGSLKSAPATVTLVITKVNDPPVAKNMKVAVTRDEKKVFRLKGYDVDSPLTLLRYHLLEKPKQGQLQATKRGKVVYTPAKGFSGKVAFKYQVSDGKARSKAKTVTLIVE